MFRWSWILVFLLLCPPCFAAEENNCTERTLIVSARDSNHSGLPYTPQAAELRGKVDNKPMQILGVTKRANPTRVALVLDASASMASKWERALEFAVEIIRESPSSTEFALVIFADDERRKIGFGPGPAIVDEIQSFKNVKPAGHTGLRDAIWEAVNMFQPIRDGDAIVVASDGGDNQSRVSPRQLREAVWSRGIRIMFAQFSDIYHPSQEERTGYADARDLAAISGGFFFPVEGPKVLPKTAQEIAFEIENYLAVHITLSTPLEKPASLHLEAIDASGRKRKNLELGFPEKLPTCASLSSRQ